MENRHGSGARAGSLGGKGFYIVLFLCAAVIGVSAWIMLTDAGTNVEDTLSAEDVQVDVSGAYVTMIPADQATTVNDVPAMSDAAQEEDTSDGEAEDEAAEPQEEPQEEPQAQDTFTDAVTSYVWPVRGNVQTPYSIQTLMYDSTMADWRTHDGIDISCQLGEPVLAAAGGTVVSVTGDDLLGTVVEIDHSNGTHSFYANLAGQPPVNPGDAVTMGQVIGSVGGTALGEINQVSHLHFAMTEDGCSADPMGFLPENTVE